MFMAIIFYFITIQKKPAPSFLYFYVRMNHSQPRTMLAKVVAGKHECKLCARRTQNCLTWLEPQLMVEEKDDLQTDQT